MLSFLNNSLIKSDHQKINNEIEYLNEYNYILQFRKQKLEDRIRISDKIKSKYYNRIPIIIDSKKEIELDKKKFIVPLDFTIGQFMYILKKKIITKSEQSIFLICNNKLVTNTELISNLYNNDKDTDGFLYIIITIENTFGN